MFKSDGFIGGSILAAFAIIIVGSMLAADEKNYTYINDECIHLVEESNHVFSQDTRTSDILCMTTLVPKGSK